MRDILERENRRGQKRITDPVLKKNRDSGHAIENVVYFELLRRGSDQRRCSQARISTTLENQR